MKFVIILVLIAAVAAAPQKGGCKGKNKSTTTTVSPTANDGSGVIQPRIPSSAIDNLEIPMGVEIVDLTLN
jgi:hypothetical protein